jgi:hypothetical protein
MTKPNTPHTPFTKLGHTVEITSGNAFERRSHQKWHLTRGASLLVLGLVFGGGEAWGTECVTTSLYAQYLATAAVAVGSLCPDVSVVNGYFRINAQDGYCTFPSDTAYTCTVNNGKGDLHFTTPSTYWCEVTSKTGLGAATCTSTAVAPQAPASSGTVTVAAGQVSEAVNLTTGTQTVVAVTGTGSIAGAVTLGTGNSLNVNGTNSTPVAGAINGPGAVNVATNSDDTTTLGLIGNTSAVNSIDVTKSNVDLAGNTTIQGGGLTVSDADLTVSQRFSSTSTTGTAGELGDNSNFTVGTGASATFTSTSDKEPAFVATYSTVDVRGQFSARGREVGMALTNSDFVAGVGSQVDVTGGVALDGTTFKNAGRVTFTSLAGVGNKRSTYTADINGAAQSDASPNVASSGFFTATAEVDLEEVDVKVRLPKSTGAIASGSEYTLGTTQGKIKVKDVFRIPTNNYLVEATPALKNGGKTLTVTLIKSDTYAAAVKRETAKSKSSQEAIASVARAIDATHKKDPSVQDVVDQLDEGSTITEVSSTISASAPLAAPNTSQSKDILLNSVVGSLQTQSSFLRSFLNFGSTYAGGKGGKATAAGTSLSESQGPLESEGLKMWSLAFAGDENQKPISGYQGYGVKSYGTMAGITSVQSTGNKIGIVVGYDESKIQEKIDSVTGSKLKNYLLGSYGFVALQKGWFFDGSALGIFSSKEAKRLDIVNGLYAHRNKSYTITGSGRLGYTIETNNDLLLVKPFLASRLAGTYNKAYTETSDRFRPLHVGANTQYSAQLGFGTSVNYGMAVNEDWRVAPELTLQYMHEYNGRSRLIDATWAGAPIKLATKEVGMDIVTIGTEVKLSSRNGVALSFDYMATLKNKYVGHSGFVKLSYAF